MNVKDTVWTMLMCYPSIFPDKTACYAHLFLTIGNGFEWVDGELVDICSDPKKPDPKWQKPFNGDTELTLYHKRIDSQLQFNIDHKDEVLDESLNDFSINKICMISRQYSAVFTAPDDIKPDWKVAIEETKRNLKYSANCVDNTLSHIKPALEIIRGFKI